MYMNDGDWVESCTALVEHHDGRWEIITWTKEKGDVGTNTNSGSHEQSPGHSGTDRTGIQGPVQLRDGTIVDEVATKIQ
jgi:hypothetical protein